MQMKTEMVARIWAGKDPFIGFPKHAYAVDMQGWNSTHRYLNEAIDEARPAVVVEIGVWKGGSVMTMARRLRDLQIDGVVIAIDTWLGSWDHWVVPELFDDLGFESGYPKLYHRFMANVINEGLQDYVVPLPLDSTNAVVLLGARHIRPKVVHIDAGHDYTAVTKDLEVWWPMIESQGILVCNDYFDNGAWPDVRRAVDDFFARTPHLSFSEVDGKAYIRKPLTTPQG